MEKILQGENDQNVLDGEKLHFKVSDLYPVFLTKYRNRSIIFPRYFDLPWDGIKAFMLVLKVGMKIFMV